MKLILKVDAERLTLNDLIAFEESPTMKAVQMRDLLARFCQDENGAYLSETDARKLVGNLSLAQLQEAVKQFKTGVDGLSIPNSTGNVS